MAKEEKKRTPMPKPKGAIRCLFVDEAGAEGRLAALNETTAPGLAWKEDHTSVRAKIYPGKVLLIQTAKSSKAAKAKKGQTSKPSPTEPDHDKPASKDHDDKAKD